LRMSETNNAQSNASGRNHKILLGVCGVVIVALIGVIFALVNRPTPAPVDESVTPQPQRAVLVTEDNVQEVINEFSQPVEAPPSYRVRMSTTWHFADGESASDDAYVSNARTNKTDVYFDLILTDSDETVLQSPIIPVGASMRNMKLDKVLEAGTYPAVVVYHLVDENQNTLSTVRMGVTLVVAK